MPDPMLNLTPVADFSHDDNWHLHLGEVEGPETSQRLAAQRRLHELLVKASRLQVWRLRHQLPGAGSGDLEDLAQQAADDAHLAVLRGLPGRVRGRSRFSTWVFKFGILQAGVAVRRQAWRHREVTLSEDSAVCRYRSWTSQPRRGQRPETGQSTTH